MSCGVFTNAAGQITIVHDKVITDPLRWLEFDTTGDSFTLVYENGETQPLGITLSPPARANLLKAQDVDIVCIADKERITRRTLTLIIRDY